MTNGGCSVRDLQAFWRGPFLPPGVCCFSHFQKDDQEMETWFWESTRSAHRSFGDARVPRRMQCTTLRFIASFYVWRFLQKSYSGLRTWGEACVARHVDGAQSVVFDRSPAPKKKTPKENRADLAVVLKVRC